jgi:hypothetical protein
MLNKWQSISHISLPLLGLPSLFLLSLSLFLYILSCMIKVILPYEVELRHHFTININRKVEWCHDD